jgi:hypothetical protein
LRAFGVHDDGIDSPVDADPTGEFQDRLDRIFRYIYSDN